LAVLSAAQEAIAKVSERIALEPGGVAGVAVVVPVDLPQVWYRYGCAAAQGRTAYDSGSADCQSHRCRHGSHYRMASFCCQCCRPGACGGCLWSLSFGRRGGVMR